MLFSVQKIILNYFILIRIHFQNFINSIYFNDNVLVCNVHISNFIIIT